MRTITLFVLTVLVLVFGAIAVFASPRFTPAAARPTPSPLFVIENPPPTPSPTPTPTPTPVATANATVTFNVPVYKQLRNLDCETAALQMALAALGHNYTQNELIAMQPPPDTRQPVMGRLSNGQKIVVQWGNPYKSFVGNIDGADLIPTGYGIYYPPLLALVQSHGVPNAQGGEGAANGWTPARIYAELVGFGARGWSGAVRFPRRAAALRRRKAAKIVQRGIAVRARQGKQARLMPRHGAHLSVAPLNP